MKTKVYSALKNDPVLSNLVAGRVIFMSLPDAPTFPCLTYYEQNNYPALKGDSKELASESVIVVDVWSLGSTTAVAKAVDAVMAGLNYIREFAADLYETDTKVYHKSMRYRNKSRRY